MAMTIEELKKALVEAFSAAIHRAEPDKIYQQLSKALYNKRNAILDELLEAAEQVKHRAEPENRPLTLDEVRAKNFRRPEQMAAEKWEE